MVESDPKSSVHNEQFGNSEDTKDKKSDVMSSSDEKSSAEVTSTSPSDATGEEPVKKRAKTKVPAEKKKPVKIASEKASSDTESLKNSSSVEEKKIVKKSRATASKKEIISDKAADTEKEDSKEVSGAPQPEKIDYARLSKEDLVGILKDLIDSQSAGDIRRDVEVIKTNFYKKHKADLEEIKKNFLDEGGQEQDFKIEESPIELSLKELLNKYRDLRNDSNKRIEEDKIKNLEEKQRIIECIKELVNSQESLNKTFHDFRELQNKWHEVGPIPQQNLKDIWESYHYQVEAFYDYIKINKELRDLDLKKNLEEKIKLCEAAEELLLEPSVVEAFSRLQKLHDHWREAGPVAIDKRTDIWERFKEATSKINKKHQEYFVNLKQEQKKNYEEKLLLCEKANELNSLEISSHKDWEEKSRELIKLQKIWKSIGFAPKKYNTQVYDRFRKACDEFFDKKRKYYAQNRDEQQNNLQLKIELCIQAEGLQESKEWKKTTDELLRLQKKWKEIGPVPIKQSDKIWKRFRAACDVFFNNKSQFFSHIDTRYEENLEKKNLLIKEIEEFKFTNEVEKNLETLKELQRRWTEIGYVPIKNKNEVQERYRIAINSKFDQLKLDDKRKSLLKFRSRVENIVEKPNSPNRMRAEREKYFTKLKQLESDIALWENNIGFFANSENAESMISDVKDKITNAKKRIEELKGKIKILDEFDD